jgi:HSP20 family protein
LRILLPAKRIKISSKAPGLVLTAEVPGVKEDDIEIKIEDNTLSLSGQRKFEKETKEENYHRIERSYGSFYRSFTLPNFIDHEKIRAEHENGLLRITLPKRPDLKARKVRVLKPTQTEKEKGK